MIRKVKSRGEITVLFLLKTVGYNSFLYIYSFFIIFLKKLFLLILFFNIEMVENLIL